MKINRRSMLRTAGALVAAASLQKPVLAQAPGPLTLVDPSLRERDLRDAHTLIGVGAKAIQPDLVRQWRDGLCNEIARASSALAYVRWDKALILTGLARESGMVARQRRLRRGLFEIRIEKRHDLGQST